MAVRRNKSINLKRYKSKREANIGIFIFAIVFIYLIVTIFMYTTTKHISTYEVRKGSILKDTSYIGLVLRQEQVIPAEGSGCVTYFYSENSKLKKGSNVYMMSAEALLPDTEAGTEGTTVSSEKQGTMLLNTQNFNENFDADQFSSVYSLKTEVTNVLQDASNMTKSAQLDAVIAEKGGEVAVYQAPQDGILSLSIDDREALTVDTFQKADLEKVDYESIVMNDSQKINTGDAAYKLVTSESWSIVVELDENMTAELAEMTSIKTKIDKDNESIWADFSLIERDGTSFGCLTYDNSMIRYAQDRYLEVQLILEDESGLKIPKSSVTEKQFYVVPNDYITQGGNSSATGVLRKTNSKKKDDITEFLETSVCHTTEDGYSYLNPSDFEEGDVLIKPDSTETLILKKMEPLKGVYNINKGYAVFDQVTILCESDEYYIVEMGTANGLSNFDYIVQDGKSVEENEVVFQ